MRKYFFTLTFVFVSIFGFSKNIHEIEKSEGYATFLLKNNINKAEMENSIKNTSEVLNFKSTVYEYNLKDKFYKVLIIVNNESDAVTFAIMQKVSTEAKLYNSNGTDVIYNYSNKINLISNNSTNSNAGPVEPSLSCTRATVKVMKAIVSVDDTSGTLCDLSIQCNAYLYIVAAAYCSANNNTPPKSN